MRYRLSQWLATTATARAATIQARFEPIIRKGRIPTKGRALHGPAARRTVGNLLLPDLAYVWTGGIPSWAALATTRLDDHPPRRKGLPQANLQTVVWTLDLDRICAGGRPSRAALVAAGLDDYESCGDWITCTENCARIRPCRECK